MPSNFNNNDHAMMQLKYLDLHIMKLPRNAPCDLIIITAARPIHSTFPLS